MLTDVYGAAEFLGRTPQWIWRRVRLGVLPAYNLSRGSLMFDTDELRVWYMQYRVGPRPKPQKKPKPSDGVQHRQLTSVAVQIDAPEDREETDADRELQRGLRRKAPARNWR